MTTRWKTFKVVLRTLATHRAAYKLIGLILVSLGVTQGVPLVDSVGNVICIILTSCTE
jgi:hypothetical protein